MGDRAVTLWGALGALLFLAALLYTPTQAPDVSRPTTEDAGPNGYLGLSRWLELEGVSTVSLRRRLDVEDLAAVAPPVGNVLVITLPQRHPLRAVEIATLRAWVAAGNTVLVLAALDETPEWLVTTQAGDMLEDLEAIAGLAFTVAQADREEGSSMREDIEIGSLLDSETVTYAPVFAHPLMAGVNTLEGTTDLPSSLWRVSVEASDVFVARLAYESTHGVDSLWQVPRGNGNVFVSASSSMLGNRQLDQADNGRFFANLLAWHLAPDGVVLFDDMHQGLSDLYDPEAFFADNRLHTTFWFVLGFWLLYLLGGAARLARTNAGPAAARQADLVAATGRFMERKLAPAEAGRAMVDNWLRDLRHAGLLSPGEPGRFPASELERLPTIDRDALTQVHASYSRLGVGAKVDLAQLHNTLQTLRESMA